MLLVAFAAAGALGQSQTAPTLRIVSEDGNNLPSALMYGNTKVKPLRLRPGTNQPITIADADFFVQQQYVDFLSRFPDQSGMSFWTGEITGCGSNAGCIDLKRVNVSAAFFLSGEFQNTGFFVYRLYRSSFGQRPVYQNFMPETRQVAKDVVVGVGPWEATLEANKQAFLNAWVNRADFTSQYPSNMTPAAFVDKLIQTAGIAASDINRDALVNELTANNTQSGRASVLRKVAENGAFTNAVKNQAFVLMEYFGYLRRDPDEVGYQFWLGKLNEHNGNFVQADMVKAFIISSEYQSRF
jgi:hypothetical protein